MNTTQPPTTSQQRGEKQRKSLVYSIPSSKLVIASELNRFPHSFSCHETCMEKLLLVHSTQPLELGSHDKTNTLFPSTPT